MGELDLLHIVIYITLFLFGTTLLQIASDKTTFPYTVMLLITGLVSQLFLSYFDLNVHISLPPDFIYYFLLPLLLFEAAAHINIHQFKIHFKTITFLATFGLLTSVFIIAVGLSLLLQLPFEVALLFGTIISATDPIAVLALFKTLGAPKRLALIADGESMFNDATAVIAFRLVAGFIFGSQTLGSQTLFQSTGNFIYTFLGSILLGLLLGYLFSLLIQKVNADRILTCAFLTTLALGSFSLSEHFLHLSGVITTVLAGISFGTLGHGKIKNSIVIFVNDFFHYLGFLSLSLVFFFASFNLNLNLFTNEIPILLVVIAVVLFSRACAVYLSVFITNVFPGFRNEPNIPMAWQHILNWGGLRGVIPLVLVYSLPDSFIYKELMLRFTLATLLFTLFVNDLTIKALLKKLRLHLPQREEEIIADELNLFRIDAMRKKLQSLPKREFSQALIRSIDAELFEQEKKYKNELINLSNADEFLLSLKLQALRIERSTLERLFIEGRFSESVLYEFESELDLQQDAIEYPQITHIRTINRGGEIHTRKSFRKRLFVLRRFLAKYRFVGKFLGISEKEIVNQRYSLLRARIFTSYAVLDYLKELDSIFTKNKKIRHLIGEVREVQNRYIAKNKDEVQSLIALYPQLAIDYQKKIIDQLLYS